MDLSHRPFVAVFPDLPVLASSNNNLQAQVTQVFHIPAKERRFYNNDKFDEGESVSTYQALIKETHAHIEIYFSENKSLTFIVNGMQNEVIVARHRILAVCQTEPSKQISIPKEMHSLILDKYKQQLDKLEKDTDTKINFPDDEVQSDIVTITGTKKAIQEVEYKIKLISDELNFGESFERISVPQIYHSFICGPHNNKLSAIVAKTGSIISIPPLSVQSDEITIAGETQVIVAAKKTIMKIYTDMKTRCKTMSVEVPKCQHKYVMGYQNYDIAEILQQTGVSVEVPSADLLSGTITLRGPRKKLAEAADKVHENAKSGSTPSVKAPVWIHKYIIGEKGANIKRIFEDLPKVIIEFTVKEDEIKIEGPSKKVKKAQKELNAIARELIRQLCYFECAVNSRHYKHFFAMSGAIVNRLNDGTDLVLNIFGNESTNRIRFEGNPAGIRVLSKELDEHRYMCQISISKELDEFGIGPGSADIRKISEETGTYIPLPAGDEKSEIIVIFGNSDNVEKAADMIHKIEDKLRNVVTEELSIPRRLYNSLTCNDRKLIRSIINDSGVFQMKFPPADSKSYKVTIRGPKESVEQAKLQILDENVKRLASAKIKKEQMVEAVISVDPKYDYFFIEDNFLDDISELYGGVVISYHAGGVSCRVTLKGPRNCVDDAKQFIRELIQDLEEFDSYLDEMQEEENAGAHSSNGIYSPANYRRAAITAPRVQWGRKRRTAQSFIYY